jgi:hypothetical protein
MSPLKLNRVALLAILLASPSCVNRGGSSPAAPTVPSNQPPVTSPGVTSTALSVRVLTRSLETPIEGASVLQNSSLVGKTNSEGVAEFNVPIGVEFHISVTASGYVGLGSSGTVESSEVWTFYLERAQN